MNSLLCYLNRIKHLLIFIMSYLICNQYTDMNACIQRIAPVLEISLHEVMLSDQRQNSHKSGNRLCDKNWKEIINEAVFGHSMWIKLHQMNYFWILNWSQHTSMLVFSHISAATLFLWAFICFIWNTTDLAKKQWILYCSFFPWNFTQAQNME